MGHILNCGEESRMEEEAGLGLSPRNCMLPHTGCMRSTTVHTHSISSHPRTNALSPLAGTEGMEKKKRRRS